MAIPVRDVMTEQPTTLPDTTTALKAAHVMRDSNIGDVIVVDKHDKVCGIVTDRDLVVRLLADGKDPKQARLGDICSRRLIALTPTQTTDEAVKLMRDQAVRRLPVVDSDAGGGRVIGIVSLGDLAVHLDKKSVLGQISAAEPSR